MSDTVYGSSRLPGFGDRSPRTEPAELGQKSIGVEPSGRSSYAIALLDGSMLIVAAVLASASGSAAGPGAVSLLVFGGLSFGLLALSRGRLEGERMKRLTSTGFVLVPLLTAVAAAALALWQTLLFGVDQPATESARIWLIATSYLLGGRLAFAWASWDRPDAAVAQAVERGAKRLFDVIVAGTLLVLTVPAIAFIALFVKLEDRGPVFFRCARFGELGRDLPMLKFRKMRREAVDGSPLTSVNDDRFTRVGRVLANYKLDELPQLWNVLRGEMSLVGPRPEDPRFVAMHPGEFAEIVGVKPGVTGLCQLAFAKEGQILDVEDRLRDYSQRLLPQKIAIDLLYVRRRTFLFDVKILAWTFVAVLLRKDVAVSRQTGDLTLRRRRPPVATKPAGA